VPQALGFAHRLRYLFAATNLRGKRMTGDLDNLKASIKRWTLFLGVLQITVGCAVGFIPPSAVEWFRGIVMAHIEFTANGVLMVAFGFLVWQLAVGRALFGSAGRIIRNRPSRETS